MEPNRLYAFKLRVTGGRNKGESNTVWFYTGRKDIRDYRVKGDGVADDTEAINEAIINMSRLGGGILRFTQGTYNVRTIHLQSNVWLHLDSDATIQALPVPMLPRQPGLVIVLIVQGSRPQTRVLMPTRKIILRSKM